MHPWFESTASDHQFTLIALTSTTRPHSLALAQCVSPSLTPSRVLHSDMKAKWPMLHAASLSARLLSKHEAPPAQQLPYSLRNRNFGNPPLPVSSFFDPKRLKQRHKHRLPKHKRLHFSQLEDKARQRLANNPYGTPIPPKSKSAMPRRNFQLIGPILCPFHGVMH